MNIQIILSYLSDLEKNNNREWYHSNKQKYKASCVEFENLIQELIFRIGKTDNRILDLVPKELTFKLVRDTRYSKDKSPYNPAFRAHIGPSGKLPIPVGYYISIRPNNLSFIGGGLFTDMFKDATTMVRDYINDNGKLFQEIISDKKFAEAFSVKGDRLKNVPKVYDTNHLQGDYLKNKNWYLEYPISDDLILDVEKFLEEAVNKFLLMQNFNTFLNRALEKFHMPSR